MYISTGPPATLLFKRQTAAAARHLLLQLRRLHKDYCYAYKQVAAVLPAVKAQLSVRAQAAEHHYATTSLVMQAPALCPQHATHCCTKAHLL